MEEKQKYSPYICIYAKKSLRDKLETLCEVYGEEKKSSLIRKLIEESYRIFISKEVNLTKKMSVFLLKCPM